MTNFDFKEWADLYQVDPAAFELRREAVLEGYVASADPAHRLSLEQTLFKIRMIRQRSKSPLQSAMESSRLMWESFGKLREQVENLDQELQSPQAATRNSLRLIKPGMNDVGSTAPQMRAELQQGALPSKAQVIDFRASDKRGR